MSRDWGASVVRGSSSGGQVLSNLGSTLGKSSFGKRKQGATDHEKIGSPHNQQPAAVGLHGRPGAGSRPPSKAGAIYPAGGVGNTEANPTTLRGCGSGREHLAPAPHY